MGSPAGEAPDTELGPTAPGYGRSLRRCRLVSGHRMATPRRVVNLAVLATLMLALGTAVFGNQATITTSGTTQPTAVSIAVPASTHPTSLDGAPAHTRVLGKQGGSWACHRIPAIGSAVYGLPAPSGHGSGKPLGAEAGAGGRGQAHRERGPPARV